MSSDEPEPKIIVDEDWKSKVEREREELLHKQEPEKKETPRLAPASFAGLVSSLSTQAAAALADVVAPPSAEQQEQLDPQFALQIAKHLIDTLGVLEQKTRGNLSADEDAMLQQALHELRIAFVEVQKR